MNTLSKSLLVCISALFFLCSAFVYAGVKEFNEAMSKGDFQTAASETQGIWQALDKAKPSAVMLAREFAYVNFMANEFASAQAFIEKLDGSGEGGLSTPDDQPESTEVLASAIRHRLELDTNPENTAKNRERLVRAIQSRLQQNDTDVMSIMVTEYLYQSDATFQDWVGVVESAKYAAEMVGRAGPEVLDRQRRAEVAGAVAGARVNQADQKGYDGLVALHDIIVTDVDSTENANMRAALTNLKWQLQTWIENTEILNTQYSHKLKGAGALYSRALKTSAKGHFFESLESTNNEKPVCEYGLDTRKVFFPQSDNYKGQVGTVLFKMDVDGKGKVSNAAPLYSVPEERYSRMMGFWGNSIKMKRVSGQSKDDCQLEQANALVPVSFEIEKEQRRR